MSDLLSYSAIKCSYTQLQGEQQGKKHMIRRQIIADDSSEEETQAREEE